MRTERRSNRSSSCPWARRTRLRIPQHHGDRHARAKTQNTKWRSSPSPIAPTSGCSSRNRSPHGNTDEPIDAQHATEVPTTGDASVTAAPGQFSLEFVAALQRFRDSFRADMSAKMGSVFVNALGDALSIANGRQDTREEIPTPTPWQNSAARRGYNVSDRLTSQLERLITNVDMRRRRPSSRPALGPPSYPSRTPVSGRTSAQQHDTDDDGFVILTIFLPLVVTPFMRTHSQNIFGSLPSRVVDDAIFRPPLEGATDWVLFTSFDLSEQNLRAARRYTYVSKVTGATVALDAAVRKSGERSARGRAFYPAYLDISALHTEDHKGHATRKSLVEPGGLPLRIGVARCTMRTDGSAFIEEVAASVYPDIVDNVCALLGLKS